MHMYIRSLRNVKSIDFCHEKSISTSMHKSFSSRAHRVFGRAQPYLARLWRRH